MQDYLMIGVVLRPQGVHGECRIRPYAADLDRFAEWKTLYLEENGGYTPIGCAVHRIHDGIVYATLGDCATPEDVERLRNRQLFIDRAHAAPPAEGSVYIADLLGCEAVTREGTSLGVLTDVLQHGSSALPTAAPGWPRRSWTRFRRWIRRPGALPSMSPVCGRWPSLKIEVLTTFPEMFSGVLSASILGRAVQQGLLDITLTDIRDYSLLKHKNTDDYPFGGGAGMVMLAQPVVDAMAAAASRLPRGRRIFLGPRGRRLTTTLARELAGEEALILLCGHYEGVDQRALDTCIDEEISIGDYILTGGELPAMVLIDCVARFIPGVLGSAESPEEESFSDGLLEYPQYTRPRDFQGLTVPETLLSGDHARIQAWRRKESLRATLRFRPDLLSHASLSRKDLELLEALRREEASSSDEEGGPSCFSES